MFYPCASFLGTTNLARCWMRDRMGEEICTLSLALWVLEVLESSANTTLMLLQQTLENEGLAIGPILALRQHPRKLGPDK